MQSLQSKLQRLGEAFAGSVPNSYHYYRMMMDLPYLVWQEDSEDNSFNADNSRAEQLIHGTTDYFTKTEYDPAVDAIQDCLEGLPNVSWRLNSVQYEENVNVIHYEWEWWCL